MRDCSCQLPSLFSNTPLLQKLIYLDISNLPGSVLPLLQSNALPALRILKVRGRELDDSALCLLISRFGLRLWSLDVSSNKISDDAVQSFRDWGFSGAPLRTNTHMQVEGNIVTPSMGTSDYGEFLAIQESDFSSSFCHPERYLVDAPAYTSSVSMVLQEYQAQRLDGSKAVRQDSADAAKNILLEEHGSRLGADDYLCSTGITHLRLSYNTISAHGVQKLVRISNGHIEDLACDSMPLLPKVGSYRKAWPPDSDLHGILGAAHLFRPVFSSNLRVLRIHHSLVTNIPSLRVVGLSSSGRQFLAETAILRRVEIAYPQTFIPDMNPRLLSLTLTCLPLRSSGPLISRLLQFLKLLATQERGIQDASFGPSTRHSPGVLQGLRHLRLEFERDSMEDTFIPEDVDPAELMNSGEKVFSFFEDERTESRSRSSSRRVLHSKRVAIDSRAAVDDWASGTARDSSEFIIYDADWNGDRFSIPVWAGPNNPDAPEVLKDYRRLVLGRHVRDGVGPVSPAQMLAGAPPESFIFHVAWSAAVMPPDLRPPTRSEVAGMRDVLDELRAYRLSGRANYLHHKKLAQMAGHHVSLGQPHYFWTGRLEVSTEATPPLVPSSQYWR
ncbi:uncharacterized protein MAM_04103 [Metarhizium album ARSEF 1941]|uniref:Leucine rich repeat domain containing protein n=1 Tax=Metarhizium album (strain ARSEF 1941) TaxID=1081103 RepID=A0A0B2WY54_METAS|nr:uncharacterized protein MAM_04103 [Metarhizium album ARSEF 1941]KHN98342.1 hypothetical protein MAM_04103 [Metarhizium album ARSEF 1941]